MKKTRSDAKWLSLAPAQLATLEEWLFTEQISFTEALARAQEQFAFIGSIGGIKRFYDRTRQIRVVQEFKEMAMDASQVTETPGNDAELGAAAMKFLTGQFFRQARADASLELSVLAKVFLQNEANGLRRETNALRRDSLELTRKRMKSAEKHWEFDAMEAAKAASPLLQQVLNRLEKEKPTPTYKERIRAIRIRLFGSAPERIAPLSEESAPTPAANLDPDPAPAPQSAPTTPPAPEIPSPIAPTPNTPAAELLPSPATVPIITPDAKPVPPTPPATPAKSVEEPLEANPPVFTKPQAPTAYSCGVEIVNGRPVIYG